MRVLFMKQEINSGVCAELLEKSSCMHSLNGGDQYAERCNKSSGSVGFDSDRGRKFVECGVCASRKGAQGSGAKSRASLL